jgi:hypothetical protein
MGNVEDSSWDSDLVPDSLVVEKKPKRRKSEAARISMEIRETERKLRRLRAAQAKLSGGFIRGPIPVTWMATAASISVAATRVGLALWYVSGCERGTATVRISYQARDLFALDNATLCRGAKSLVEHGLLRVVEQRPGSYATYEILPAPAPVEPLEET